MSTVAVTMAGRGQRFRDAGYDVPKFAIEAHGRTLFRWSMASLRSWTDAGAHFVFIARAEDDATPFVARQCALEGIASFDVVTLDATTDGQATTAMRAGEAVRDRADPFVVYNIDTHVRPHAMRAERARGDGWVPCFPGEGDAWSFARTEGDEDRVAELREKERISPHATVGLYWFGSFDGYARAYERRYGGGRTDPSGERYIAPMYNALVEAGLAVYLERLAFDDVVPLGTPAEVERFSSGAPPA